MKALVLWSALLSASLLSLTGCGGKTISGDTGPGSPWRMNLVISQSALRFYLCDSTVDGAVGYAEITDSISDAPLVDRTVGFYSCPGLGFFVGSGDTLITTTDSSGRAFFVYNSGWVEGLDTITVCARFFETTSIIQQPVSIARGNDAWYLEVDTAEDTLNVPSGQEDSTLVTIGLTDTLENEFVSGYAFDCRVTGGRMGHLIRSNLNGVSQAYWHSTYDYGRFWIIVSACTEIESTSVLVLNSAR